MLRQLLLILSGNFTASLFLLARNLIVARLISVADYGIAATFMIVMAVVEMTSQLGLQQQIVQARDGEDPRLQAGLQGFQLLRGAISGGVLFFAADWIAGFMGVPEAAWAYRVLALVPVLSALQHFDMYRLNRQMRFGPLLVGNALAGLVSLLAVWPLSIHAGDYRVMLYAIVLYFVVSTAYSHLAAERPYRLTLDAAIMKRSLRFGWPLLINGFLLFAVFQGDKVIVARELGIEPLAFFAMGTTLSLTPQLVASRSLQNFFLPQLSRSTADAVDFARLATATLQTGVLATAILCAGIALLGGPVVQLLLSAKYAVLAQLLPLFAVMHALRLLLNAPVTIAMAQGQTTPSMFANLARIAMLPVTWMVATQGGSLAAIIWTGIAGEFVAVVVSYWLVRDRIRLRSRNVALPHLACATLLGVTALLGASALPLGLPSAAALILVLVGTVAATLGDSVTFFGLRRKPGK